MNRHFYKSFLKAVVVVAIVLLAEIFLSNQPAALMKKGTPQTIDLNGVTGKGFTVKGGKIVFDGGAAYVDIRPEGDIPLYNIQMSFKYDEKVYITGRVDVQDENIRYEWRTANTFDVDPGGKRFVSIPVISRGNIAGIRINLSDKVPAGMRLTSVRINSAKFAYNWYRVFLILALIAIVTFLRRANYMSETFDIRNWRHCGIIAAVLLVNITIAVCIAYTIADDKNRGDIPYPLERSAACYDSQIRLFDALMKGRLWLETDYSQEEMDRLANLENPYDWSLRTKEGVQYHWDYAYYNGRYYRYFGTAPVISLYFPYYFIHGALPREYKAGLFFSVLLMLFLTGVLFVSIELFQYRIPAAFALLLELALPAVSAALMCQACSDMYYLVYLSGMAYTAGFIFFTFLAYLKKNSFSAYVWLFFAGICFVFIVASRPTMAMMAFFLLAPLYLHVLKDNCPVGKKLRYITAIAVPVICGAVLIMAYNYFRFDSVFSFGQEYQLTIYDDRYNSVLLSPAEIFSSILNYTVRGFQITERFPFIIYPSRAVYGGGKWIWGGSGFGIFSIPINWLLLLLPFFGRKKELWKRLMLYGGALSGLCLFYFENELGGSNIRYVMDTTLVFALLSCVIAINILSGCNEKGSEYVKYTVVGLLILSTFIGYMMIFVNERNSISLNSPDTYIFIENLFKIV